ncbi:hypothetical protein FRC17_002104 [Serendipita sp. 399]|nr:hypothetical protein FRC17_002104 [Serendipita sp. 399]
MLFFATISALLAISGVQAGPSLGLSVGGSASVQDVDNFRITATLTNTGDETLTLYADPRSALSSFPANSFAITGADGALVPFVGAKAKYLFKSARNFVVLAPGESKTITHDLSASYNFTQVGDYEIEAVNLFHYQDASGNAVAITADAPSAHLAKLTGNLVSSTIAKRSMRNYKRAGYKSCSSSRQSTIAAAFPYVKSYLSNAVSYLSSHSSTTTRYSTWFVLNMLPSQAIIHESSHFTANGGTQDYAYGQTNAKALAKSNPSKAIMNADSHEYFAENTPVLS